eukprot:scaffold1600_cov79-Skeletonema_dohrnii-CCMP3373.AAC.2
MDPCQYSITTVRLLLLSRNGTQGMSIMMTRGSSNAESRVLSMSLESLEEIVIEGAWHGCLSVMLIRYLVAARAVMPQKAEENFLRTLNNWECRSDVTYIVPASNIRINHST